MDGLKPKVITPESIQDLTSQSLNDQLKELQAAAEAARDKGDEEERAKLDEALKKIQDQLENPQDSLYAQLQAKSALIDEILGKIDPNGQSDDDDPILQEALAAMNKHLKSLENSTESIGKNGTPEAKKAAQELNARSKEARENPSGTTEAQVKKLQALINEQLSYIEPKLDQDTQLEHKGLD